MNIEPLATRMRPKSLSEVVGQEHLIGENKLLTRIATAKNLTSIILYGPPGTGKTSIARALSNDLNRKLEYFNASIHSKKELEGIVKSSSIMFPSIVLIDEVHRLTKPNQDYLLMKMEEGSITLIGATTENPYMSINPALRSRSQILELKPVNEKAICGRLKLALEDTKVGLGEYQTETESGVLEYISSYTNGDMRAALNTLELAVVSTAEDANGVRQITQEVANTCLQNKQIDGDKNGDSHYNMLSAFQKSIRGSDVDASLHYLARLIRVGDLMSINRRLLVIAYEDIGLANPNLVSETLTAIETTERIGFPEARIVLSYIVVRLAMSAKSNLTYKAIGLAEESLNTERSTEIPISLHDNHYKGAKNFGKGEGYKYSHDYPNSLVEQQFLPNDFKNDRYLLFDEDENSNIQARYNQINDVIKPG